MKLIDKIKLRRKQKILYNSIYSITIINLEYQQYLNKYFLKNYCSLNDQKGKINYKFNKLFKYNHYIKHRNKCLITGKSHFINMSTKLSRLSLRYLCNLGLIRGICRLGF